MQRKGNDFEYEDIRLEAIAQESMPKIEITNQVMQRIDEIQPKRLFWGRKWMWSRGLVTGIATLFLFSMTAYAASEYIQIRNSSGVVKVQYAEPQQFTKESAQVKKYYSQAMKVAKPGELIAYSIKNARNKGLPENMIHFAYKELRITEYSSFSKENQRTKTPIFPKTVNGYEFEHGTIWPNTYSISESGKDSARYHEIQKELDHVNHSGKADIVTKSVTWNEAGSITATYTKNNAHIGISAVLLQGGHMKVEQQPENKANTVLVEGREVIFNSVNREDKISYHYLNWFNEEQDAYYTITTYGDRALSREKLIQLAGELIREGL